MRAYPSAAPVTLLLTSLVGKIGTIRKAESSLVKIVSQNAKPAQHNPAITRHEIIAPLLHGYTAPPCCKAKIRTIEPLRDKSTPGQSIWKMPSFNGLIRFLGRGYADKIIAIMTTPHGTLALC